MNDEALELDISIARDCLDRTYIQHGRRMRDLSDADLCDAWVRGMLKWLNCRTDCQLLDDAGSELRLRRLEPPHQQAGSTILSPSSF
ncbi:hypothetical protein MA20_22245 [Bradyrhizobium japonicum]|uniref:Uncharacterized protein n=1 Tax=Bradyrhizobium japonicum TaxID=375 RepID=A0A0A3XVI8_BRAJP|nr:hypothetical protein [Bradyrhizobium japonicum]KGT77319.1 hypothetical protein MA20_22245 [Bradyrhizobium japonicum]